MFPTVSFHPDSIAPDIWLCDYGARYGCPTSRLSPQSSYNFSHAIYGRFQTWPLHEDPTTPHVLVSNCFNYHRWDCAARCSVVVRYRFQRIYRLAELCSQDVCSHSVRGRVLHWLGSYIPASDLCEDNQKDQYVLSTVRDFYFADLGASFVCASIDVFATASVMVCRSLCSVSCLLILFISSGA